MSEPAVTNDMVELNGGAEQPVLNGETENGEYSKILNPKPTRKITHSPPPFRPTDKSPGSVEDKTPDSALDNDPKKGSTSVVVGSGSASASRGKKRKKAPRDATAPKQPLTGYFR